MDLNDSYSYGTFTKEQDFSDAMPDLERTASRGQRSPSSPKEDIAMRPLADQASETASIRSEESYDSCQAGVKRAEAIASTWTRTSLYVAYFG